MAAAGSYGGGGRHGLRLWFVFRCVSRRLFYYSYVDHRKSSDGRYFFVAYTCPFCFASSSSRLFISFLLSSYSSPFGGELVAGRLASGGSSGSLLGTSHGVLDSCKRCRQAE